MHARPARANVRVGTGNGARMHACWCMHGRPRRTTLATSHRMEPHPRLPTSLYRSIISAADDDDTVYAWIVASSSVVYYSLRWPYRPGHCFWSRRPRRRVAVAGRLHRSSVCLRWPYRPGYCFWSRRPGRGSVCSDGTAYCTTSYREGASALDSSAVSLNSSY
jgi:hypothetical protein